MSSILDDRRNAPGPQGPRAQPAGMSDVVVFAPSPVLEITPKSIRSTATCTCGRAVLRTLGRDRAGARPRAAGDGIANPGLCALNLSLPNVPPDTAVEVREATLAPFGIVQTTMTEPIEGDARLTVRELPGEPLPVATPRCRHVSGAPERAPPTSRGRRTPESGCRG